MRWFWYNLIFAVGYPLLLPRYLPRMWRRGGYRRHFCQRFGRYAPSLRLRLRAMNGPIWIHGVSVGEVGVATQLMLAIREQAPQSVFVISTNTSTGYAQACRAVAPIDAVVYPPVDYPGPVRRAFRTLRPRALILIESEIWPNLIRCARQNGLPLMLVNARVSDRSFPGYRRLRSWFGPLLRSFDLIQAQSALDRDRLLAMGAQSGQITVSGSFKYDAARRDAAAEARARALLRRLWPAERSPLLLMGGSTWPGEEQRLLSIFEACAAAHPALRLILAPRHAERAARIAAMIAERGFSVARLSRLDEAATEALDARTVLLIDTTGDLMRFYAAADVVFVGKSLCAHGAQNMIEPVACGKATVVGPHTENFRSVMDDLLSAGAIRQIPDAAALEGVCRELLADADARTQLAQNAARVMEQRRGVSRACALAVLQTIEAKQTVKTGGIG